MRNIINRLKRGLMHNRVKGSDSVFAPGVWKEHFASLTADARQAVATELCRKALEGAEIQSDAMERAITSVARGDVDSDVLRSINVLVQRFEAEYDRLVADDDGKLSLSDPHVEAAFVRARAASTLKCALEGDFVGIAYEAWFVLGDLNEIQRVAGMS